jgi:hypothetical protein
MDRKNYTDEEIAELGRKALQRLKVTVYVVIYTHKTGVECTVYGSQAVAQRAVHHLMVERADTSWEREDWKRFQGCETYDHQVDLFHKIEQNVSYGETIELLERVVQG